VEHRQAIKSPLTTVAQTRALAVLERMAAEGQDPARVIEQSIVNGWKGFFPVKDHAHRGNGHGTATRQQLGEKDYTRGATRDEDLPDWARNWRGSAHAQ
jgi:hypothetical protein